jgi:hypothetical protein
MIKLTDILKEEKKLAVVQQARKGVKEEVGPLARGEISKIKAQLAAAKKAYKDYSGWNTTNPDWRSDSGAAHHNSVVNTTSFELRQKMLDLEKKLAAAQRARKGVKEASDTVIGSRFPSTAKIKAALDALASLLSDAQFTKQIGAATLKDMWRVFEQLKTLRRNAL